MSSGTSWKETGLTTGQTYSYTIEACNAGGCSIKSNPSSLQLQAPVTKKWSKLMGTSGSDRGWGVSVDASGNVYVTGHSEGNFDGHNNAGDSDMFLVKYNSSGGKQWSKLIGSSDWDDGNGVSVDAFGNIYVAGHSQGNFDGHTNAGDYDMFLVKYNSSGGKQWSKLMGTSDTDSGWGVSVDASGNVYVTGYSRGSFDGHTNAGDCDMFLVKYNSSGGKQWSKLIGSSDGDYVRGMSVDASGNAYVTGYSKGNFDGHTNAGDRDMFVVKYDSSGGKQWSKLMGTSALDEGYAVSVDASGNVYVAGNSSGNFDGKTNAGGPDMFLVKYNSSGGKQWSKLMGTSADDKGLGVSVDASGNVYVAGRSYGNFDGHTNAGHYDMLLIKYNSSGGKQWSKLMGSSALDEGYAVSVDASGNVYVAGHSQGNFDGKTNAGGNDMFLVKYDSSGGKQWSQAHRIFCFGVWIRSKCGCFWKCLCHRTILRKL